MYTNLKRTGIFGGGIQVRTELQHRWAQLSEKLSDVVDPMLKYGGGPESLKSKLLKLSEIVGKMEVLETRILTAESRSESIVEIDSEFTETKKEFKDLLETLIRPGHLWEINSNAILIQYDRQAGKLVKLARFADDQRLAASKARLDLEIDLRHRGQRHEVVLPEAASEEALHKTHGRYFENVEALLALASSC